MIQKPRLGKDKILKGRVSPDLAIAEGAAIQALHQTQVSGTKVVDDQQRPLPPTALSAVDVTPHPLGVTIQDPVSKARRCSETTCHRHHTSTTSELPRFYYADRENLMLSDISKNPTSLPRSVLTSLISVVY